VASGLIEDRFAPVIEEKVTALGSQMMGTRIVPDDRAKVTAAIRSLLDEGAGLVVTTAGMSVDPDDVTRLAIADAGGRGLLYGAPVLPGAMFLVGMLEGPNGEVPVLGVPACALYFKTTIFDLILPRVLAGERMSRQAVAELAHGGFCRGCDEACRFPSCGFGRGL
jgi:formylmethanofuran dehydrogenase subunit E